MNEQYNEPCDVTNTGNYHLIRALLGPLYQSTSTVK